MIYLDNAATTRMYDEAIDCEKEVEMNFFANPSALHSFGMEAENLIKKTKKIFAKELSANENEIYFTKGATESNNIVISSFASENASIITSSIEHASIYDGVESLNFKNVHFLRNDNFGYIDLDDLKNSLNPSVKIVSVIYVNNEVGTVQDIKAISKIVKDYNKDIFFHIDATQALGKISCNVKKLGVDGLSFSGHKIHGPKGVGGLYINKNFLSKIKPLLLGGRQDTITSGTFNTPGIYAMGRALELMKSRDEYDYIKALNTYFRKELEAKVDDIYIVSPKENASPYILDIGFANVKSEVLLHMLEDEEIYVSSGSACSKGKKSRILSNLNVDEKYIDGALRFSFSSDISIEDLDKTIKVLKDSTDVIRKVI